MPGPEFITYSFISDRIEAMTGYPVGGLAEAQGLVRFHAAG